jgi:hypothetical protein
MTASATGHMPVYEDELEPGSTQTCTLLVTCSAGDFGASRLSLDPDDDDFWRASLEDAFAGHLADAS